MKSFFKPLAIVLCLACPLATEAAVIDFETIPNGVPSDGLSIGIQFQSTLSTRFRLPNDGLPILMQTGNAGLDGFVGYQGVMDTLKPDAPSIGDYMLHSGVGLPPEDIGLIMQFSTDMAFVSGMILDCEPRISGLREAWLITAYGADNTKLGEVIIDGLLKGQSGIGSDSDADIWAFDFATPMIRRVEIEYTGDVIIPGYGFDNFNVSITAIPEPSTAALMFLSIGAAGWVRRRRRVA